VTDQQLQTALQRIADEVTVVDLRARVQARTRVLQRRRRAVLVAAPVAAVLVAAALLSSPSGPESAPPADRRPAPTVQLSEAPAEGLVGARLSVIDMDSRAAWLVTATGRAARLPVRIDSIPGARPALSADGTMLSFWSPGVATLVRSADGEATTLGIPGGQAPHVSLSPDGSTVAYAVDTEKSAIELTLVPLDRSPPTTLTVTTSAAGALVPVVWSDDGSGVLVLDGKGATRVDLQPRPSARRGVHAETDLVLANGWAAAPDLSRFVMSDAAPLDGEPRRWLVLDSDNAHRTEALTRPVDDRLIGWTADDRLVWWHRTGTGYSLVTSDTSGRFPRTELRLTSSLPNLAAAWSEDQG
jgi:hypothetical protein